MHTLTTFLEVITKLIFVIAVSFFTALTLRSLFAFGYKTCRKRRRAKVKALREQQKSEVREQEKVRLLNKLVSSYKNLKQENEHLTTYNQALLRELKLYTELRAEMSSYSIRQEQENFDLNNELNKANKQITAYHSELERISLLQQASAVSDETNNKNETQLERVDIDIHNSTDDYFQKEKDEDDDEYFEELAVDPAAVLQAKGVVYEEMTELPSIMRGEKHISDIRSAVIVAKMQGTTMFDDMQNQIKGAKQNIGSLIDRIDKKLQSKDGYIEGAEEYFYENTGFSIRDFLPPKTV